jgi:hypothetical protein
MASSDRLSASEGVLLSSDDSTLTRVNSINVQNEGLRIGGIGRQMNSKLKSVKQGVYQE